MSYTIKNTEVWVADVLNRPETLARVLEALAQAGAQLEFLVARRVTEKTSRIFLSPLTSKKQKQAATDLGLVPAKGLHSIRVEGPDHPGLGAEISRSVAAAGINIRGSSAAKIGRRGVFYLAFKEPTHAAAAAKAIRKTLSGKKRRPVC